MSKKWWSTKRATTVKHTPDGSFCIYRDTAVVQWTDKEIVLDNGGYDSMTTRSRMNQVAKEHGLKYGVYREKGRTLVYVPTGHVRQRSATDKDCPKAFKVYEMDEGDRTTVRFSRRKRRPRNCPDCAMALLANA